MKWLIDLLIDKLKKEEEEKEFEPTPLHIEDTYPISRDDEEENNKDPEEKRVIIIDL